MPHHRTRHPTTHRSRRAAARPLASPTSSFRTKRRRRELAALRGVSRRRRAQSRKSAAAARDARSVAAVAAAIAEAATRGVDICAREVAALAREGGVATERELSEETRDTRDTRGFARRESDATNGEEEEETNDANALDANALGARETLNRLVPIGPSKRAVLSAYIPKRRDRRHTRKTTPPKVEKPKNAAAAGAVRGLVRGFRLRGHAALKRKTTFSGERGETTRVHAGTRARVRYAQHVVFPSKGAIPLGIIQKTTPPWYTRYRFAGSPK